MTTYPSGIFKKPRKSSDKESYDIDKDPEVQREIAALEEFSTFVRRSAHRCELTEEFLENIGNIGGIYRKYSEINPLKMGSLSYRRFKSAMKKATIARELFIKDCDCRYKKKFF